MSANVTLGGRTYNGVSTIAIGTARFLETSDLPVQVNTVTSDAEYIDANENNVDWFVSKYFGANLADGVYIASVTNNTQFSNPSKANYALDFLMYYKFGSYQNGIASRGASGNYEYNTQWSGTSSLVGYLAQGAVIKTTVIKKVNM